MIKSISITFRLGFYFFKTDQAICVLNVKVRQGEESFRKRFIRAIVCCHAGEGAGVETETE